MGLGRKKTFTVVTQPEVKSRGRKKTTTKGKTTKSSTRRKK